MNRFDIGPESVLSAIRRQAITWTIAGINLIGLLGINPSENIQNFAYTKFHLEYHLAIGGHFVVGGGGGGGGELIVAQWHRME